MQNREFLRLALVALIGCSVSPRAWADPPLTIEASVRATSPGSAARTESVILLQVGIGGG